MTEKRSGPPLKEETLAVRVPPKVAIKVRRDAEARELRVSDWLREAIEAKLCEAKP